MQIDNEVLELKLTVKEVNILLELASKGPYDIVEPLISRVRTQCQPQVNALMMPAEGEAVSEDTEKVEEPNVEMSVEEEVSASE